MQVKLFERSNTKDVIEQLPNVVVVCIGHFACDVPEQSGVNCRYIEKIEVHKPGNKENPD